MSIRNFTSQVASSIFIDSSVSADITTSNVQDAIVEAAERSQSALDTPIYTILLQYNGTVSNNTFIGYDSLLPGDSTPIIIPKAADFTGFSFSNGNSDADYTLEFRKNSTVATPFYTISKINTQFFQQELPTPEDFLAGDQIYIKYIDDGTNANDVAILLNFRAEPV